MVSAMDMPPLFLWLDPYLIWFFRLTDHAAVNFFIGTAVMALLALLLGKLSAAAVLAAGRHYSLRLSDEAKKYQDLSIQALQAGDRPAYEAGNTARQRGLRQVLLPGGGPVRGLLLACRSCPGLDAIPVPGAGFPYPAHRLVGRLYRDIYPPLYCCLVAFHYHEALGYTRVQSALPPCAPKSG